MWYVIMICLPIVLVHCIFDLGKGVWTIEFSIGNSDLSGILFFYRFSCWWENCMIEFLSHNVSFDFKAYSTYILLNLTNLDLFQDENKSKKGLAELYEVCILSWIKYDFLWLWVFFCNLARILQTLE